MRKNFATLFSMEDWQRVYKCEMCGDRVREDFPFQEDMQDPDKRAARIREAYTTVLMHRHSDAEFGKGTFVGFQLAAAVQDIEESIEELVANNEKKTLEQKLAISELALRIERDTLTRVRAELTAEIEKLREDSLRAYGLTPEEIQALRAAQAEAGKLRSELEDLRAAEKFREENRLRPEEEGCDWQVEVTPEAFRNCLELAGKPEEGKPEEGYDWEREAGKDTHE